MLSDATTDDTGDGTGSDVTAGARRTTRCAGTQRRSQCGWAARTMLGLAGDGTDTDTGSDPFTDDSLT